METELPGFHARLPQTNLTVEKYVPGIGLEAIDHLVLIAVLLCSVGLSLNGTLRFHLSEAKSKKEDYESTSSVTESEDDVCVPNENSEDSEETTSRQPLKSDIPTMFAATGSIIPFFINTLSLFSLSGEIYANDTSVSFFIIGLLLSVVILTVSGIPSILAKANISTVSGYFKIRYKGKTVPHLIAGSTVVRHILGGALTVHVVSIAAGAASGISAIAIAFAISASAAICVSVGGIRAEMRYSIGRIWLVIMSITSFTVLSLSTADLGGIGMLIEKAHLIGKINWPSISLYPWEYHSYCGTTILGIIIGCQIFLLARASLKNLAVLRPTYYYISLAIICFINILWVTLAAWAGLCSSVTFSEMMKNNGSSFRQPPTPEGSLAVLIFVKLYYVKGFRGFFLASLLAASISGLTRRFNQMIAVIWGTWHDIFKRSPLRKDQVLSEKLEALRTEGVTDEFLRELKHSEQKEESHASFLFKAAAGLIAGTLCIGILWLLQACNLGSWELWQGIVGVLSGSILGALFLGLFFPCFPHMSVVLGLLIGWCLPCYLLIGNISTSYQQQVDLTSQNYEFIEKISNHEVLPLFREHIYLHKNITGSIFNEEFFRQQRQWMFINGKIVEVTRNGEEKTSTFFLRRHKARMQKRYILFRTSYCYYGFIGALSCIITALLFTATTNRCQQKEFPPELIHPMSHVFLLLPTQPRSTPANEMVKYKPRKIPNEFATMPENGAA